MNLHAIELHPYISFFVYYVLSNAASHLPTPLPEERWYKFVFGTIQSVFGNSGRVVSTLFPAAAKYLTKDIGAKEDEAK